MDQLFGMLAIAMLGLGARQFILLRKNKGRRKLQQRKLEVWEAEGGAVPAGRRRTVAQVAPRARRKASPRRDARR